MVKHSLLGSNHAVNSASSVTQGDSAESFTCQMTTRIFGVTKEKGNQAEEEGLTRICGAEMNHETVNEMKGLRNDKEGVEQK